MDPAHKTASLLPGIATQLTCEKVIEDKLAARAANEESAATSTSTGEVATAQAVYRGEEKDSDDDMDMEDSKEYMEYKQKRIAEMKAAKEQAIIDKAKGHGEYREIIETEFLEHVTKSARVVCHFYHRDFERCKIVDMHLKKISATHLETRFIKIDAEKAPFFVCKLLIKVLPTIVCFLDGVATDRVVGFDELGARDDFPTLLLTRRLVRAKVIQAKKKVENPDFHLTRKKEDSDEDDD